MSYFRFILTRQDNRARFCNQIRSYSQEWNGSNKSASGHAGSLDILKKGGNAIDAAIAANAVLGVVEPTGCGIGGDLFAIIWSAEKGKLYGLNASGRSPRSLKLEYFRENGYEFIPSYGPLPVSVPGCVDGWYEMHDMFGRLPMKDILQPAISYARDGFPVTEVIAYYLNKGTDNFKRISEY